MRHPLRILTALFSSAILIAAAACSKPADTGPDLVLVEVAPLVSLVEPLLARGVEIRPIVPPGVSPHGYQLTPSDATDLARASLVITVGPTLEPAISRAVDQLTPEENVFSIADALGIDTGDHDHDHSHDHSHDHDHAVDPHLWLDPILMLEFVQAIDADLVARGLADENHAGYLKTLTASINGIANSMKTRLAPFEGRSIVTHHNAFSRIADRYGLNVAEVVRPVSSVEPTPGDIAAAAEALREMNAGAIFVEPQFPDAMPRRIADQLGIKLYKLDPTGNTDWFDLMRFNLLSLELGLSEPGPADKPDPDPADPAEPEG